MLSQTVEYALRTVVYLASQAEPAANQRTDFDGHESAAGLFVESAAEPGPGRRGSCPARRARRVHAHPLAGKVEHPGSGQRRRSDPADSHLPARAEIARRAAVCLAQTARRRLRDGRAGIRRHHVGRDTRKADEKPPAVRISAAVEQADDSRRKDVNRNNRLVAVDDVISSGRLAFGLHHLAVSQL